MPSPIVGAADAVAPTGDEGPTIMVALSNPRTEGALVRLAAAIADHRDGRLLATHVVTVPDQTPLDAHAERAPDLTAASEALLDDARRDAEAYDVPIETRTVISHRGVAEVFDAAREHDADGLVLGFGGDHLAEGRAEGAVSELARDLPCDVAILNDREFDPDRILIPTAGGGSSDLSAEIGRALRETAGAEVSLLHVVEDGETDAGREFLEEWAAGHDLADADLRVETGDVEVAIERAAGTSTVVIMGATERGLLSRLLTGSLVVDVIEDVDASVILAERPSSRSLLERLLGRR